MDTTRIEEMRPSKKKLLLGCASAMVALCILYVVARPQVFNESFFSHAHCMSSAGAGLQAYAMDHDGSFPFHTNGYSDALLLATNYCSDRELTGPGYDEAVFQRVRRSGENASEEEFGRVYVQGLKRNNHPEIAILFDKAPTPGGDHCHLFRRLWAPMGREVYTVGDGMRFVRESEWGAYARHQIELLVAAGFEPGLAQWYYSAKHDEPFRSGR